MPRYPRRNGFHSHRLVAALSLAVGLGGCAYTGGPAPREIFRPDPAAATAPIADSVEGLGLGDPLRQTVRISEHSKRYRPPAPPAREASPFDHGHPAVEPFLDYYAEDSPQIIVRSLARARPHLPTIRATLSGAGVPAELAYLPIVESHFDTNARSRAGATGIWQLMRATAKHFGLRIDRCVDERRDPLRSTEAAARYLAALHDRFEDWHLALAAYNIGEGRIYRIMQANDVDDYWTMVDRALLPRETAQFVPKFMAAATVAEQPVTFGIDHEPNTEAAYDAVSVQIEDPLSLSKVAALAGVDRTTLAALNPALACGRVPVGGYPVRLPRRAGQPFKRAYAKLDRSTISYEGTHHVRQGESPASIARLYGVSVRALMRENGIRNPRRLRINTRLRIPSPT